MYYMAHKDFYSVAVLSGNIKRAELHKRWLLDLVPWYVPRIDSLLIQGMELLKSSEAKEK
jgi:hypothetical protein